MHSLLTFSKRSAMQDRQEFKIVFDSTLTCTYHNNNSSITQNIGIPIRTVELSNHMAVS